MLLLANVDDVSGEVIPHAIEGLMARGANSVHVVPAITKKGRLEYLFFVDADREDVETLAVYLASELGTLGVRVFEPQHISFSYQFCPVRLMVATAEGRVEVLVRVKQMLDREGRVISVKAEHEDLRDALCRLEKAEPGLSLKVLQRLVEQVVQGQTTLSYRGLQAEYRGGLDDDQDFAPTG